MAAFAQKLSSAKIRTRVLRTRSERANHCATHQDKHVRFLNFWKPIYRFTDLPINRFQSENRFTDLPIRFDLSFQTDLTTNLTTTDLPIYRFYIDLTDLTDFKIG